MPALRCMRMAAARAEAMTVLVAATIELVVLVVAIVLAEAIVAMVTLLNMRDAT